MNTTDSATPQAQTQDVAVKPLEWAEDKRGRWHSAKVAWGAYYVQFDDENNGYFASLELGDIDGPIILTAEDVATVDAAKAAAQANYEACIFSAIEVRTWRPMTEAPAGDVSAVIDIWDGERRIPDCFWSDTDQCWLFEDWDGTHYINVAVTDPQAWMWAPKAPEGL